MLKEILYYGVLALFVILSTVISVNQKKSKKTDETVDNTSQEDTKVSLVKTIFDNIPKYMIAAEKLYNGLVGESGKKTGSQKLEYVLDKIKVDCLTNNVQYDENAVTEKVSEYIELTKNVN